MSESVTATDAVNGVFRLFRDHGDGEYIGEVVSLTAHSIQCGMLAEHDGYQKQVIHIT